MIATWLPVVAVCICSLGEHVVPVDSAHFMGGLIYWRPVTPAAFDGRVRACSTELAIQYHVASPSE